MFQIVTIFNLNISQGGVAMPLRCGGIFRNDDCNFNNEFNCARILKIVSIRWSYGQVWSPGFFGSQWTGVGIRSYLGMNACAAFCIARINRLYASSTDNVDWNCWDLAFHRVLIYLSLLFEIFINVFLMIGRRMPIWMINGWCWLCHECMALY